MFEDIPQAGTVALDSVDMMLLLCWCWCGGGSADDHDER